MLKGISEVASDKIYHSDATKVEDEGGAQCRFVSRSRLEEE